MVGGYRVAMPSAFLRRVSTRRLLAVLAGAAALVVGGSAIALAASADTARPPAQALAPALHAALAGARGVTGLSANVTFTNGLATGSSLAGVSDPLLSGGSGRLWIGAGGRARLELQSSMGDVEVLSDGHTLTISDPGSHVAEELALAAATGMASGADGGAGVIPGLPAIEGALARLGEHVTISAPLPTNVGGRPAYAVTLAPRDAGGLLGALGVTFDAAKGTPLRIDVYARGVAAPVLSLELSAVSYGPVDPSVFAIPAPAGARVLDLGGAHRGAGDGAPVSGADAVGAKLGFALDAPAVLDGLPRSGVALVPGTRAGALVTYGSGLGALAVLEMPHGGSAPAAGPAPDGVLPSVALAGTSGRELATPLGTVITFERAGTSFTVAGSVTPATALAAARGL